MDDILGVQVVKYQRRSLWFRLERGPEHIDEKRHLQAGYVHCGIVFQQQPAIKGDRHISGPRSQREIRQAKCQRPQQPFDAAACAKPPSFEPRQRAWPRSFYSSPFGQAQQIDLIPAGRTFKKRAQPQVCPGRLCVRIGGRDEQNLQFNTFS